jgi:hypothetical protein
VRVFDKQRLAAETQTEPPLMPMRIAIAQLQPHGMVELIEPLSDQGRYAESLARHGGADHLHHLGLMHDDLETAGQRFEQLGVPKLLDGTFAGARPGTGLRAMYYDTTPDLGFLTEITHIPPDLEFSEPDEVRGD